MKSGNFHICWQKDFSMVVNKFLYLTAELG